MRIIGESDEFYEAIDEKGVFTHIDKCLIERRSGMRRHRKVLYLVDALVMEETDLSIIVAKLMARHVRKIRKSRDLGKQFISTDYPGVSGKEVYEKGNVKVTLKWQHEDHGNIFD